MQSAVLISCHHCPDTSLASVTSHIKVQQCKQQVWQCPVAAVPEPYCCMCGCCSAPTVSLWSSGSTKSSISLNSCTPQRWFVALCPARKAASYAATSQGSFLLTCCMAMPRLTVYSMIEQADAHVLLVCVQMLLRVQSADLRQLHVLDATCKNCKSMSASLTTCFSWHHLS